jgi:outer membrane protein TolC
MEEKELNTKLDFLKNSQSSAMAAFENLINIQLGEIILPDSISLETLAYPKQDFTDSLKVKNRQLQKLKYQSLAGSGQVEVAKMMSKPSFNVGLSYILVDKRTDLEVPDNGKNSLLLPEIGMSIPIFQKKYQAMQNQAILEKQSLQYQIEEKSNQLSSEIEYLTRDYLNGQQKIGLYEQLTDLASRSISLLQTEFTTGKADFEEILELERKLLTYQLELERAKVDVNNAVHSINYLIGDEKF